MFNKNYKFNGITKNGKAYLKITNKFTNEVKYISLKTFAYLSEVINSSSQGVQNGK